MTLSSKIVNEVVRPISLRILIPLVCVSLIVLFFAIYWYYLSRQNLGNNHALEKSIKTYPEIFTEQLFKNKHGDERKYKYSKADDGFIKWLKKHKCPDEIISDILKENSRQYNRKLERHIKSCPRLFTAMLNNGYGYEAIEHIFLDNYYSGYHWDQLVTQEDIAIELVKNKCDYYSIFLMCRFKNGDSKKFFNHKEFYIELLEKLSPLPGLRISNILDFFVVDCNEQQLKKCMSNQKLLNLLIENYLPRRMLKGILQREDYKTLNINNNKELLDLLLEENLIFSNNDYPNDKYRKELVTEDTLIHNLLQINALKICDLLYLNGSAFLSTAPGIRKKAEEVVESIKPKIKEIQAQSNLPDIHHAKAPMLAEQAVKKLKCNQDEVPSLITLSIGAILNISQVNTLA
ncbi:MAG: hypothetical protein sL5_03630 [Candidatus Mesenet longicola]|uniref:Uncharacterized protein n=1 Tax=Candidatus Mesenet longicola TaxID=1892558 RepID=A0A8J3HUM5_9RICK|nr:MAG: hypothetical protein sGL2_09150 [Candidatus Mesenet longicola]GHM59370.1 MAG: hypothetical protein sL5_03630 [Candidatus Mesenet longicola]